MHLNIPYLLEIQRPKRPFKNVPDAIIHYQSLHGAHANATGYPCYKCAGKNPVGCELCRGLRTIDREAFEVHVREESEIFMKVWMDWAFSVRVYREMVKHLSEDGINSLRKYGVLVDKPAEYDTVVVGDKTVCRLPDVIPSPTRSCCRLTPRNAQVQ